MFHQSNDPIMREIHEYLQEGNSLAFHIAMIDPHELAVEADDADVYRKLADLSEDDNNIVYGVKVNIQGRSDMLKYILSQAMANDERIRQLFVEVVNGSTGSTPNGRHWIDDIEPPESIIDAMKAISYMTDAAKKLAGKSDLEGSEVVNVLIRSCEGVQKMKLLAIMAGANRLLSTD